LPQEIEARIREELTDTFAQEFRENNEKVLSMHKRKLDLKKAQHEE
jgi:hypothetical protein